MSKNFFRIALIITGLVVFTIPVYATQNSNEKVAINAVEFAKKGQYIDLAKDSSWLSKISGDISKLTSSHLNTAKMIATKGVALNADELPSLLANVSGDLSKLSKEDLGAAIQKLNTDRLDVDEYLKLKALRQLDDVDSWFNWGRYSGSKPWGSLTIKEQEQIKDMILSKGDGFEGLKESTISGQSNFDGYVIKPDGNKIPTELKQLNNSNLDTVISEIKDANKKQFLENGISNGQIKIDITNNKLTNPNDIFLNAKSYYTNPTRNNYLDNKVQIYINNEIILEFNQQNFL